MLRYRQPIEPGSANDPNALSCRASPIIVGNLFHFPSSRMCFSTCYNVMHNLSSSWSMLNESSLRHRYTSPEYVMCILPRSEIDYRPAMQYDLQCPRKFQPCQTPKVFRWIDEYSLMCMSKLPSLLGICLTKTLRYRTPDETCLPRHRYKVATKTPRVNKQTICYHTPIATTLKIIWELLK